MTNATYTQAGSGQTYLLVGSDLLTIKIGGVDTGNQLGLIEVVCPPGGGPRPHTDPWRETFWMLDGELEFAIERGGRLRPISVRAGDVVSVPAGVGHVFQNQSNRPARFLHIAQPAGFEAFVRDAADRWDSKELPSSPVAVDRERLTAAFVRHGMKPFQPHGAATA